MRRIRSAKGELVDFDVLTIKGQIAVGNTLRTETPTTIEIKPQENFIDRRTKRLIAKTVDQTTK